MEIGPNWNAGGWADNGSGTGGYDPNESSNAYDITQLQYPSDLTADREDYGSNYVMFYINVTTDATLNKDSSGNKYQFVKDVPPREQSALAGTASRSGKSTLDAGKKITGLDSENVVVNFIAEGTKDLTFTNATKRIKTAIALHMPNLLSSRYSAQYDEENTALLGGAIAGGGALAEAIKGGDAKQGVVDSLKVGSAAGTAFALGAANIAGVGGGISRLTRIATNPRKEVIFKNVDFRTFQFDYQFYPRNAQEAQYVQNIIKEFKYHMHPEFKDENAFLYTYPSEFDIAYYHGSDENKSINKHTSCVLTELTVNYAPQGQFTAFKDGTPTQINLVLTFKELALLTKDQIRKGF